MTKTEFLKPDQGLCSPVQAARMIANGRILLLAGREEDLAGLPPGCWIGGTTSHLVTPQGGVAAAGVVYFADFTAIATGASWRSFSSKDIHTLARYYPDNGFALLIMPGFSQLLTTSAGRIMEFDGLYNLPLMGWISAVPLDRLTQQRAKIFAGNGDAADERAAVLYITLPPHDFAQLHIANLFAPGTGPEIRFQHTGTCITEDCLIGGVRGNLARYIAEAGIDRRLPLVADHEGALLNVSVLNSDPQIGRVVFLSPISPALTYRFAEEVLDYEEEFSRAAAAIDLSQAAHACICALHYNFAGLSPEAAGLHPPPHQPDFTGPVSFGQIAYTVLNQTLTCLTIGRNDDGLEEFAP